MPETFDIEEDDSIYMSNFECFGCVVWSIACVILSAVDVGSDMYLGYIYLNNCRLFGDYQCLYGGLTLLFVYLASFTSVCEFYRTNTFKTQKTFTRWLILISLFITSLSGVVMGLYDLCRKIKRKKDYITTKKLIQLKYHEACVEAAPQLILQICVMLNNIQEMQNFNVSFLVKVQRTSIISSLISITVAFCKIEGQGVEGLGKIIIFYISVLLSIGPRILGLAILFNLHPVCTLLVLIIQGVFHICLYWILEGQTNWTMLSFVPLSSIIFTWLPLAVTNKWYQILPYSVCVIVQNMTAAILWNIEKQGTFLCDLLSVICICPFMIGLYLSTCIFDRLPRK